MARRNDLKAKEKRQKVMAAVGAVILLGVLAIQGPRTWKLLNQKAPEEVAPVTTTTPSPGSAVTLTPPTIAGAAPNVAATDGGLGDSDPTPVPTSSHLLSFSRFSSKDPFVAQIDLDEPPPADPVAQPTPAPTQPSRRSGPVLAPTAPKRSGSQPPPTQPVANPTTARISVNGVVESVSTGKDFPTAEPIFHLVSVSRGAAKISIAGGSLASGKATITLPLGKTVTLMNTADGTRYELRLLSVG